MAENAHPPGSSLSPDKKQRLLDGYWRDLNNPAPLVSRGLMTSAEYNHCSSLSQDEKQRLLHGYWRHLSDPAPLIPRGFVGSAEYNAWMETEAEKAAEHIMSKVPDNDDVVVLTCTIVTKTLSWDTPAGTVSELGPLCNMDKLLQDSPITFTSPNTSVRKLLEDIDLTKPDTCEGLDAMVSEKMIICYFNNVITDGPAIRVALVWYCEKEFPKNAAVFFATALPDETPWAVTSATAEQTHGLESAFRSASIFHHWDRAFKNNFLTYRRLLEELHNIQPAIHHCAANIKDGVLERLRQDNISMSELPTLHQPDVVDLTRAFFWTK